MKLMKPIMKPIAKLRLYTDLYIMNYNYSIFLLLLKPMKPMKPINMNI